MVPYVLVRVRRHRGENKLALCKTNLEHINDCYDEILNTIGMAETINKEDEDTADVAVTTATGATYNAILHSDTF